MTFFLLSRAFYAVSLLYHFSNFWGNDNELLKIILHRSFVCSTFLIGVLEQQQNNKYFLKKIVSFWWCLKQPSLGQNDFSGKGREVVGETAFQLHIAARNNTQECNRVRKQVQSQDGRPSRSRLFILEPRSEWGCKIIMRSPSPTSEKKRESSWNDLPGKKPNGQWWLVHDWIRTETMLDWVGGVGMHLHFPSNYFVALSLRNYYYYYYFCFLSYTTLHISGQNH